MVCLRQTSATKAKKARSISLPMRGQSALLISLKF
jgi:hypothetical protein